MSPDRLNLTDAEKAHLAALEDGDCGAGRPMATPVYKREIFMHQNPRYQMCDVLMQDGNYMICAAPDGREFIAKPGYGTWCEISLVDLVSRMKMQDALLARQDKETDRG